ncbi:GNAT family N-acetyltransferase [Vibrio hannami]|uniref:GNAT family N-acetyltransferase n=1 Tax=Vibrio hannami TaxID=2717094 RepID=UPI00240F12CB|nr:GNAT family N-acetyltransferase [Vibrio hannami]MDG3087194.1 GNAT family N-acetyltransferase [Vibrio hannami]
MKIHFDLNPDAEIEDTILTGLKAYNANYLPKEEKVRIACYVRNDDGKIVGGLKGEIYGHTLFIAHFWIDENSRGDKLGSKLMKQVELEVIEKGVTDIYLDTFSFQARDFYIKMGYTEVGKYTGFPAKGIDKYFLQKHIA